MLNAGNLIFEPQNHKRISRNGKIMRLECNNNQLIILQDSLQNMCNSEQEQQKINKNDFFFLEKHII